RSKVRGQNEESEEEEEEEGSGVYAASVCSKRTSGVECENANVQVSSVILSPETLLPQYELQMRTQQEVLRRIHRERVDVLMTPRPLLHRCSSEPSGDFWDSDRSVEQRQHNTDLIGAHSPFNTVHNPQPTATPPPTPIYTRTQNSTPPPHQSRSAPPPPKCQSLSTAQ
ncbi:unnamed protein product, partial [Pleuronectes platessa]